MINVQNRREYGVKSLKFIVCIIYPSITSQSSSWVERSEGFKSHRWYITTVNHFWGYNWVGALRHSKHL